MRCGYCSWLGGPRAVLFKNTLSTPPTLARMPHRWASAHQKDYAVSTSLIPRYFGGFLLIFSPDGHGLGGFFMPFCTAWCMVGMRITRSTPDPCLNYQQSRMRPACRVPTHSDIHRVKAPLSRRGTTGATYVCSKGGERLI